MRNLLPLSIAANVALACAIVALVVIGLGDTGPSPEVLAIKEGAATISAIESRLSTIESDLATLAASPSPLATPSPVPGRDEFAERVDGGLNSLSLQLQTLERRINEVCEGIGDLRTLGSDFGPAPVPGAC